MTPRKLKGQKFLRLPAQEKKKPSKEDGNGKI